MSTEGNVEDKLDPTSYRTVLYYLAVANFRLGYLEESKRLVVILSVTTNINRFVNIILKSEPNNNQAYTFRKLLERKSSLVLVLCDGQSNIFDRY